MKRFMIICHEIYTLGTPPISLSPNNKVHAWNASEIIASLDEWYSSKIRKLNGRVHTASRVLTFLEIQAIFPRLSE